MMKKRGLIFVLSGPSGSGKTTLYERLLKDKKIKLVRSISCTTRKPRRGEKDDQDYFFISRRDFLKFKANGAFLETQKVFDSFYGTPEAFVLNAIKNGQDVLLCIDVKGALVVKKKHPEAVMIFVAPPSLKELAKRLDNRSTEDHRSKKLRLKIAKQEMLYKRHYDYVIINEKLGEAVKDLKKIISKARLRSRR